MHMSEAHYRLFLLFSYKCCILKDTKCLHTQNLVLIVLAFSLEAMFHHVVEADILVQKHFLDVIVVHTWILTSLYK